MTRLAPCPDCGHQVSDKATSCPRCGRILKKPFSILRVLALLILVPVVGFVGLMVLGEILTRLSPAKPRLQSGSRPPIASRSTPTLSSKVEILSWKPGPEDDADGYTRVVGEIHNGNPVGVVVRLQLTERDANDKPIRVEEFVSGIDSIPPGQTQPFKTTFKGTVQNWDRTTLEVIGVREQ